MLLPGVSRCVLEQIGNRYFLEYRIARACAQGYKGIVAHIDEHPFGGVALHQVNITDYQVLLPIVTAAEGLAGYIQITEASLVATVLITGAVVNKNALNPKFLALLSLVSFAKSALGYKSQAPKSSKN